VFTDLAAYCRGFARASEPWPPLPLADTPELTWWQDLIGTATDGVLRGPTLLAALQVAIPQLRLPQVAGISSSALYQQAVLRGEPFSDDALATVGPVPCWEQPQAMRLWIAWHPTGAMPVLQTPSWRDFEQLVRAMSHRAEPTVLANGVHAQAVSGLIHWGLIERFGRQARAKVILLHEAPYGSVSAAYVPGGLSDMEWLAASTTLRLVHELTHLTTKRVLGEMRLNLLDELIADCMGMVAALGAFDAKLFCRCLGINVNSAESAIANGRWESYTQELSPEQAVQAVQLVMNRGRELEGLLKKNPVLLAPDQAMPLLRWLCCQRLDQQLVLT